MANVKPSPEQPQQGNGAPSKISTGATAGLRRKAPAREPTPTNQLELMSVKRQHTADNADGADSR